MKTENQNLKLLTWILQNENTQTGFPDHTEPNTKWYIVGTLWINKLKAFILSLENQVNAENPGKINSEEIIDRNPSIILKNNFILTPSSKFREDYLILPTHIWKILSKLYSYDHKITRKSIQIINSAPEIEVRPTKLNIFVLKNQNLTSITPFCFYFSILTQISDVLNTIKEFVDQNKTNKEIPSYRLWKLGRNFSVSDLLDLFAGDNKQILFPGHRIDQRIQQLYAMDFNPSDIFVFEYKEGYSRSFILKEKEKKICNRCQSLVNDGKLCQCHQIYFCSQVCESEFKEHFRSNSVFQSTSTLDTSIAISPSTEKETPLIKAGLSNIGNSCYLNSGLQCLFHTKPLTEFLLKYSYSQEKSLQTYLGSQLLTEYIDLLQKITKNNIAVSPLSIKSALGAISNQFSLFEQQDCQEMLNFLLEGLHEALKSESENLIKTEENDKVRNDELKWIDYINRNDSFIARMMHGLYRSEVQCPNCKNISTNFDPFSMLSLPIPDFSFKVIFFVLVTINGSVMGKVEVEKSARVSGIRKEINKILDIEDIDSFVLAETYQDNFARFLEEDYKLKKNSTVLIYYKQPTSSDSFPEDLKYIIITFKKKSNNSFVSIGKPHLLQIEAYLTLKELYFEVFQYTIQMRKIQTTDLISEFDKRQPSYLKKSYLDTDEFRLSTDNPFSLTCPKCCMKSCIGCPIPCSLDLITPFFLSSQEPFLRLSVLFSAKIDTSVFEELFFHPSCDTKPRPKTSQLSLFDCFRQFSAKEQLDSKNSVFCSACKTHTNGFKTIELIKAPKVMILHFKRFKRVGQKYKKKLGLISYPVEGLDIGRLSGAVGVFELFGVVNHTGGLNNGHYTATCKGFDGQWRCFDDSFVSRTDSVVSDNAYILFYQQVNSSE